MPSNIENRADRVRKIARGYDPLKALEICEAVASGKTLTETCALKGMPTVPTVHKWLSLFPEFFDAYERARELSAQSFEDEALEMARTLKAPNDFTGVKVSAYNIAMQQLRWSAARRDPKRYGQQREAGNLTVPVQINTTLNLGQSGPAVTTTESIYTLEAVIAPPEASEDIELDVDADPKVVYDGDNGYGVPDKPSQSLSRSGPKKERVKPHHKTAAMTKKTATNIAKRLAAEAEAVKDGIVQQPAEDAWLQFEAEEPT